MADQHEPAYRQVLAELRDLILSGTITEGDKLPSIRDIVSTYGVTTGTAARAVAELRAEGLIVTRHGAGAYVRRFRSIRRSSPFRLAEERWTSGEAIQQADTGERPRSVDVTVGETHAPSWVSAPLGINQDDLVAYRSRRIVVDDRPVQLATSYLPVELARGTAIMYTDTGPGGLYARLTENGYAPVNFTEYLRARMPLPNEVKSLDLPEGTPVIEITRHAYTKDGRCVEVNRMVLDATAYLLDYTFPA